MSPRALITGASSGIGHEFAIQLAYEGYDLVLLARDKARLEEIAKELSSSCAIDAEVLEADLSSKAGIQVASQRLMSTESPIDMLVNNAGFGLDGRFTEIPIEKQDEMLSVNVRAVLYLTHAAAKAMSARGDGDIINVSSVAAWTPSLRPSSTYAATKAFVTALSEGLAPTLAESGVRISVLCPGFVKTEFHKRAGIEMKRMAKMLWLEPSQVVQTALADHRAGKTISIPTTRYKIIAGLARHTPGILSKRVSRFASRRAG